MSLVLHLIIPAGQQGRALEEVTADGEGVWKICSQFTPVVEPVAIGEVWLDITGCGPPRDVARGIRTHLSRQLNLAGITSIAPTKFTAKAASLWQLQGQSKDRSQGVVLATWQEACRFLSPLPVTYLWPFPTEVVQQLMDLGCRNFAELWQIPPERLRAKFGPVGDHLVKVIGEQEEDPVKALYPKPQIGRTYWVPPEIGEWELPALTFGLQQAAGELAQELANRDLACQHITLGVRSSAGTWRQQSRLLPEPIYQRERLTRELLYLKEQLAKALSTTPVVEYSVKLQELAPRPKTQLDLYADKQGQRQRDNLAKTMGYITEKLGSEVIQPASALERPRREKMLQLIYQNVL